MDSLRQFFENLAVHWDEEQPPDREDIILELLSPFSGQIRNAASILDVGTGTGTIIPLLKKHFEHTAVYSIDLASEMLRRAQHKDTHALLVQTDVHRLPFVSSHFSVVICHNSFPHFQEKPAALFELKRVLHQDGWLFILHDLNREQVNHIHRNIPHHIIQNDLLPESYQLYDLLINTGFLVECIEDNSQHYVAAARVN